MNIESIDQLLKGVPEFWWVDTRWPTFKTYKFSFDEDLAFGLLSVLIEAIKTSGKYVIGKTQTEIAHRAYYAEFEQKPSEKNSSRRDLRFPRTDIGYGRGSPYFARVYLVEPDSTEAKKIVSEDKIEHPPSDRVVLVIDVKTDKKYRDAIEYLLTSFHTAYRNPRIPSETSAAR